MDEKRIERIEDQLSQLIRMMASIHRELVEIKRDMNQKFDQVLEKLDNIKE
jgi:prefoldin subunit 5